MATDEVIAATIEVPVADPVREDGARRFAEILGQLEPLLDTLLACPPHSRNRRPAVPHESGVYLFTEEDNHRYIGRAKDLNIRFGQHVAPKSPQNQAAFAFNVAKRDAEAAGLDVVRTREALAADPQFDDRFFASAKQQVRAMEFRFVRLADDSLSTIFEVYVSLLLGTEGDFNLFATH